MDIRISDRLTLKNQHPCSSYDWDVLRIGMDFKLRCAKCGHEVMLPRAKVEKKIKKITRDGETL